MAERKTTAGPKPDFAVVEDSLKCQTSKGELSLPLRVSFGTVRKLMKLEGTNEFEEFEFFMDNVFSEEHNEKLDALDAAESAKILTEFSGALAKRMRASLGESAGSSESSTDTEQP
jgi:hypothetical protein